MSRTPEPTAKIALLRAAEEVFAAKGLTAAKVEEITRRAKMSKGAFYLHFESKEEALRHVAEAFLARLSAMLPVPADYERLPSSPDEMVALWLDRDLEIYEFLWQNRAIVRILHGCQASHTYLLDTFRVQMRGNCEAWIESWKRRGFMRAEVATEIVAMLIHGAYEEMTTRMLASDKKPPIVAWVKEAHAVFTRGLGTPLLVDAFTRNAK